MDTVSVSFLFFHSNAPVVFIIFPQFPLPQLPYLFMHCIMIFQQNITLKNGIGFIQGSNLPLLGVFMLLLSHKRFDKQNQIILLIAR